MKKEIHHSFWLILTLMLMIMIDIMGLGLIFPTLPQLFIGPHSILAGHIHTRGWQEFFYGLAMGVWPLGLFFGAPALGHLSDVLGRRKVLLTCLLMTGLTYGLCAIAIQMHSMALFLLGRLVSGFFAGSFEISQAVIADISSAEKKARNMGWITFAATFGFTLGPLISSFTTNASWFAWFSLETPFWVAMILSLLNMLALFFLLKESYRHVGEFKVDWFACFKSVGFIFSDTRVRYFGFVFLLLQFSWGLYFSPLTAMMNIHFGYGSVLLGLLFSVLALGAALGTVVLQPLSQKLFSLEKMVCLSMILTGLVLFSAIIFNTAAAQWWVAFISAAIEILAYTGFAAIISNSVKETEQGTALGGLGALVSIAWCLSGVLTGPVLALNWHAPTLVSAGVMLLAGLLMIKYFFINFVDVNSKVNSKVN